MLSVQRATKLLKLHIHIVNIGLHTCSHNENSCLGMSQIAIITITTLTARRVGSDGSMSASSSAGPVFNPWRGSKF